MGHLREAAHDCDYKLKGFFFKQNLTDSSAICCHNKNQYFPDNDERMNFKRTIIISKPSEQFFEFKG